MVEAVASIRSGKSVDELRQEAFERTSRNSGAIASARRTAQRGVTPTTKAMQVEGESYARKMIVEPPS